jgi:hypothetical protein
LDEEGERGGWKLGGSFMSLEVMTRSLDFIIRVIRDTFYTGVFTRSD